MMDSESSQESADICELRNVQLLTLKMYAYI